MKLIEEIREAWGWFGIDPVEVVGENDFGNLIIKSADGQYWRLIPEDCECKVVARNRAELDELSRNQEFLHDWNMVALVEAAKAKCGDLPPGSKYSLCIPGLLSGEYGGDNLVITPLVELIRVSGQIARETKDLPDGEKIKLRTTERITS
jgi:hypothetical protein